jgi:hypothetical protein
MKETFIKGENTGRVVIQKATLLNIKLSNNSFLDIGPYPTTVEF